MIYKLSTIIATLLMLVNQPMLIEPTEDYRVIPDEAIRLRILAESDHPDDQQLKHAVRDAVNQEITTWVEELTSVEQARETIQNRLDQVDAIVAETVADYDPGLAYQVDYDANVLFPAKLYDYYVYPAGEYEAILITLGEGQGSNWWCVLFPPLCFLDFSAGTTVTEGDSTEAEVDGETSTAEVEEAKIDFFFLKWFR